MKNQATETAKPDFVKSVLDRLSTIIRICGLDVILQSALGTLMAARAQGIPTPL